MQQTPGQSICTLHVWLLSAPYMCGFTRSVHSSDCHLCFVPCMCAFAFCPLPMWPCSHCARVGRGRTATSRFVFLCAYPTTFMQPTWTVGSSTHRRTHVYAMQYLDLVHVQNEQPVAWRKLRGVFNLQRVQTINTTPLAMPDVCARLQASPAIALTTSPGNVRTNWGGRYLLLEGVQQGIVPRLACALARVLLSKLPAHWGA